MMRGYTLLAMLAVAACSAEPGRSSPPVDGGALIVALDESYYWPAEAAVATSAGAAQSIDVFPLVAALLVSRRDGTAMTEGEEDWARAAAEAHCRGLGRQVPGDQSRLADGAWAFPACVATGG